MQTECRVAANPQTNPVDLGSASASRLLPSSPSRYDIITRLVSWYSFYNPTEGGRLSRPGHCSKGVQPVPKAVYRNGCCDKHSRLRPAVRFERGSSRTAVGHANC